MQNFDVTDRIMGNGLKVIYAPDRSNPLISVHIYVRIGSGWENDNEAGYSHFAEHLVFKSTRSYPQGSLMDRVAFLGGSINAYTEYDSTCYYIEISSEYYRETLKIISELVQHSDFSEKDFQSEKMVIFEELKETENDPEDYLLETIAARYLAHSPYSRPIIGNRESLQYANRKKLQDFIKHYYFPANCVLVVCGDYEKQKLDLAIDEYFGNWQIRKEIVKIPQKIELPQAAGFELIDHQSQSDVLAVALPALEETHPQNIEQSLVFKAFCMGKNSFLYEELLKRKQLVDNIKLSLIAGINSGVAVLMLFPRQDVEPLTLIEAFYKCWHDFCTRGISAVKLMNLKAEFMNSYRMSREYVDAFASNLGVEEINSNYLNYFSYPQKLQSISRLRMRKVIDEWLTDKYMKFYYQGKSRLDIESARGLVTPRKQPDFEHGCLPYVSRKLSNGINVLYHRIKGKPTAGIAGSFAVSQLYESGSERGLNFLTSALMLYGNELYNYDKLIDFCALHGMNFTASPALDFTVVEGKCFIEDLPLALEVFASILFKPLLPREHFDLIKSSVLSSWHREKDYPQKEALRRWKKMYFGTRSKLYRRQGMRQEFSRQTLAKVKKWHGQHYTPQNLNLVITGDFAYAEIDEIVEKYFGSAQGQKSVFVPDYSLFSALNKKRVKDAKYSQGTIVLGGQAPGYDQREEALAMSVLCQILGGDSNSLLFNELREKKGLAYSVDMDYYGWRKAGTFICGAMVDRSNINKSIKLIKSTLAMVAEKGVSEYELQKVKNHLSGQMLQQEESVSSVAVSLSNNIALGRGEDYFFSRHQRLAAVTCHQVHEIAKKFFKEDKYYIQVIK